MKCLLCGAYDDRYCSCWRDHWRRPWWLIGIAGSSIGCSIYYRSAGCLSVICTSLLATCYPNYTT